MLRFRKAVRPNLFPPIIIIIIINFNALILKTINPDSIYPIKDIYK